MSTSYILTYGMNQSRVYTHWNDVQAMIQYLLTDGGYSEVHVRTQLYGEGQ